MKSHRVLAESVSQTRNYRNDCGFTLTELLLASLITAIVTTIAGVGLVNILKANQKLTREEERQGELTRALDFIANDIKEARSVSTTVASKSGYQGVFELVREDGIKVSYYTSNKKSGTPWRGPRIVYRQLSSQTKAYPLVDLIADVNPSCNSSGSEGAGDGLKVFVQDSAYVKVCLVGQLNDVNTLQLEAQAFTRGLAP